MDGETLIFQMLTVSGNGGKEKTLQNQQRWNEGISITLLCSPLRILKVELSIKNWSLAKILRGFIFTNTSNFVEKNFLRFFRNV